MSNRRVRGRSARLPAGPINNMGVRVRRVCSKLRGCTCSEFINRRFQQFFSVISWLLRWGQVVKFKGTFQPNILGCVCIRESYVYSSPNLYKLLRTRWCNWVFLNKSLLGGWGKFQVFQVLQHFFRSGQALNSLGRGTCCQKRGCGHHPQQDQDMVKLSTLWWCNCILPKVSELFQDFVQKVLVNWLQSYCKVKFE